MNYVITGSLGHISRPVTERLVEAGQNVTVITSKQENAAAIQSLGATAAVGSVEDSNFIDAAFTGADAVYLMIPPKWQVTDWYAHQQKVADNYVTAVKNNHIKNVIQLSSIGAHLRKGAGPVDGLAYLEEQLEKIKDINVLILRPSYFFNNLFGQADLVKKAGIFGANHGGDEKLVLADTDHIAMVAGEALINLNFTGYSIEYIANDERTTDEIAKVLGEAIGKPGTPWIVFSDEQSLQGMRDAGVPDAIAKEYVQMGKSINSGLMQEDYWKHQPTLGKMKLEDFAKAFAEAYRS